MAPNRRWTHKIPGVLDRRVNTLLVVPGTEAADWREGQIRLVRKDGPRVFTDGPIPFADGDWTIRGQGIVLDQSVAGDLTLISFRVLWVYPFWVRWILTWVNARAQARE